MNKNKINRTEYVQKIFFIITMCAGLMCITGGISLIFFNFYIDIFSQFLKFCSYLPYDYIVFASLIFISIIFMLFYESTIKRLRSLNIKSIYFNIYLVFMYLFIVILNIDILFYISLISLALVFILLVVLPNSNKVEIEEIKEEHYANKSYYIDIALVLVMLVFLISLVLYHPSI
ncbi:hypothetical protein AAX26_01964 [Aliarcobacter thereius]|uniref:hypothetical protein n=1 Tax=Aliarcobacter thereius TaxID=544718 RepID=UPI000828FF9E|nr:hypothetical protein [Aliarcobacter thereius]OCL85536.1 hypothetical protein AAX26_01964 [Aliarcobacter thereius]